MTTLKDILKNGLMPEKLIAKGFKNPFCIDIPVYKELPTNPSSSYFLWADQDWGTLVLPIVGHVTFRPRDLKFCAQGVAANDNGDMRPFMIEEPGLPIDETVGTIHIYLHIDINWHVSVLAESVQGNDGTQTIGFVAKSISNPNEHQETLDYEHTSEDIYFNLKRLEMSPVSAQIYLVDEKSDIEINDNQRWLSLETFQSQSQDGRSLAFLPEVYAYIKTEHNLNPEFI